MNSSINPLYTPYGAYELKSKYQRNMLISNVIVITSISFIVSFFLITAGDRVKAEPDNGKDPKIIEIDLDPITFTIRHSQTTKVRQPDVDFAIPIPVSDEDFYEDETEVTTTDSFYSVDEIESEPFDNGTGFGAGLEGGSGSGGLMPGVNQFKYVDRRPEVIKLTKPEYPRLAIEAGLEGTVWIAAHVDIDGSVSEARVYKSSTLQILDEAALIAAYKNKFRPAIQNNQPIKLWVSYKVEFVLDR